MAHKKGQGSSRNGRDSAGQRRGVKVYGGEAVKAGSILMRQLGTVIHPGSNVRLGRESALLDSRIAAHGLSGGAEPNLSTSHASGLRLEITTVAPCSPRSWAAPGSARRRSASAGPSGSSRFATASAAATGTPAAGPQPMVTENRTRYSSGHD